MPEGVEGYKITGGGGVLADANSGRHAGGGIKKTA